MYDKLIKKIRHCATDPMHCLFCGEDKDGRCFARLMTQAANAIEELQKSTFDVEPTALDLEEMVSEAELCISTAELVLSDAEYKEFTERVTELL